MNRSQKSMRSIRSGYAFAHQAGYGDLITTGSMISVRPPKKKSESPEKGGQNGVKTDTPVKETSSSLAHDSDTDRLILTPAEISMRSRKQSAVSTRSGTKSKTPSNAFDNPTFEKENSSVSEKSESRKDRDRTTSRQSQKNCDNMIEEIMGEPVDARRKSAAPSRPISSTAGELNSPNHGKTWDLENPTKPVKDEDETITVELGSRSNSEMLGELDIAGE